MDPLIGASLISLGGGLLNNLFQSESMDKQVSAQKDLMKYQWDNFSSPAAQAKSYAAAGFNPATALGNGNISSSSPSAPSVTPPQFSVGIENLSELGSFMKSVADAKKAGVDTSLSEQEIRNKQVQQKRDEFELELRKTFGKSESVLNLANAYQQVLLAQDSHDLNLIDKAIKDWQKAKEKALSELSEHERDIAAKRLANTDTELKLQNDESRARANASNAAANLSNQQAKTESELRDLRVTAQTLSNGISALSYDLDAKTLQSKVEEIANRVGAVKWSNLMSELQYKDAATYNAIQRLLRGNSQSGDIGTILKALKNYEELNIPK